MECGVLGGVRGLPLELGRGFALAALEPTVVVLGSQESLVEQLIARRTARQIRSVVCSPTTSVQ